jgi:protein-L-isoaspartate(D-aspartate) O-methyltransferase
MGGIEEMLRDIDREVAYTRRATGIDAFGPRVMAAMRAVPRHAFVPLGEQRYAYANGPLPIGQGQTISQPYIVALMTELLRPEPGDVVLEIGTGSGYQAAVLSCLVERVYSLEVLPALARDAAARLADLGFDNVTCRQGDGNLGWPEPAPYDGIIVTAAAPAIPPPLVEQLRPGARLVIPVGPPYGHQVLRVVEKDLEGATTERDILGVVFVPLIRPV